MFSLTLTDRDGQLLVGQHTVFQFDNFEHRWIMYTEMDIDLCIMLIPLN